MSSSRVVVDSSGWIEVFTDGPSAGVFLQVMEDEDRLRVLDALYIPTRYPDSLPEGAPTDHFGRLQSQDAIAHARALTEAIRSALAQA